MVYYIRKDNSGDTFLQKSSNNSSSGDAAGAGALGTPQKDVGQEQGEAGTGSAFARLKALQDEDLKESNSPAWSMPTSTSAPTPTSTSAKSERMPSTETSKPFDWHVSTKDAKDKDSGQEGRDRDDIPNADSEKEKGKGLIPIATIQGAVMRKKHGIYLRSILGSCLPSQSGFKKRRETLG